ncbi:MAG: GNAT family N-acetyltransferase [Oscillospiraceae bacterium]
MIELRPITEENFEDCINLDVKEEQQDFIAENMCSLAEAYVAMTSGDTVPMPYGIYDAEEDVMVGFLMLGFCEEGDEDLPEPFYCVWRIMIDANCQGMGYGREAMEKAVELVKERPLGSADKFCAAYTSDNDGAAALFEGAGMTAGEADENGNVLAVMDI